MTYLLLCLLELTKLIYYFNINKYHLRILKEIILLNNASTLIEIDGGVTNKNAQQLVEAGADVLVAGNYVFKAQNPIETIKDLKKITQ